MEKVINNVAHRLSEHSPYSQEVLEFCLKLWTSNIMQSICMILISYMFFDIKYFIYFFILFFPMRLMIDGYHSKTFKRCFIISTCLFILICVAARMTVDFRLMSYFGTGVFVLAVIYLIAVCVKKCCGFAEKVGREKFFSIFNLVYTVLVSCFLIYLLLNDGSEYNPYFWVLLYSYCAVFILTIFKGVKP